MFSVPIRAILIAGIDNGIMAQLLDLVSSSSVLLKRIEKEYTFDGYESRLMDKMIWIVKLYCINRHGKQI